MIAPRPMFAFTHCFSTLILRINVKIQQSFLQVISVVYQVQSVVILGISAMDLLPLVRILRIYMVQQVLIPFR